MLSIEIDIIFLLCYTIVAYGKNDE